MVTRTRLNVKLYVNCQRFNIRELYFPRMTFLCVSYDYDISNYLSKQHLS